MKKNRKYFIGLALKLLSIAFFLWVFIAVFVQTWSNEYYIIEGGTHFGYSENDQPHFIADESTDIESLPQSIGVTRKNNLYQKGPYLLGFVFGDGIYGEDKIVKIHNIEIVSSEGINYQLKENTYPIIVEPDTTYNITRAPVSGVTEISYIYVTDEALNFNFLDEENIFVTLDVEILRTGQSKREIKTFKLERVLDKGWRFWFPGIDV